MRSRQRSLTGVAIALALTVTVTGCLDGWFPHKLTDLKLSGAKSQPNCMSRGSQIFENYLRGSDPEFEMGDLLDCAADSLRLFGEKARGSVRGEYSPQELRNFLQTYFIKDYKLTDRYVADAMELKQALVGGARDKLSHEDLIKIREFLGILKQALGELREHLPLTPERATEITPTQLNLGIQALENAAATIGSAISQATTSYTIDQMSRLLENFGGPINPRDAVTPRSLLNLFRDKIPLIRATKSAFLDGDSNEIQPHDWGLILTTGARWYGTALRLVGLPKHPSVTLGSGREQLVSAIEDGLKLLEDSIARHPKKLVTLTELDRWIKELWTGFFNDLPPGKFQLKAETVSYTLRPFLAHIFGDPETYNRNPGLAQHNIVAIRDHFSRWSHGQKDLENAFDLLRGDSGGIHRSRLLKVIAAEDIRILLLDRQVVPYFSGDQNEISFELPRGEGRFTLHELSERHSLGALTRILIHAFATKDSYGTDHEVADYQGFHRFYSSIRDLFVEVGFFPPEDDVVGMHQRFREANLFTDSGDGGATASALEMSELLSEMISARRMSDRIHARLITMCKQVGTDFWGQPALESDCFFREYLSHLREFWGRHLPHMVEHYESLDADRRRLFEEAFRGVLGFTRDFMTSTETQTLSIIAQYIEIIFRRWNLNGSGIMDQSEARNAFPIYQTSIGEAVSLMNGKDPANDHPDPDFVASIYNYLMAYGETPTGVFDWLVWKVFNENSKTKNLQVDRLQLLRVFAAMAHVDHQRK